MRNMGRAPFPMRKIAAAVVIAAFSMHAGASLMADGKLGDTLAASAVYDPAAEGYSVGWLVGMQDDKGNLMGNAEIWFGEDSTTHNQFLYVMLPEGYVDNTYGTNASPEWKKGHTFDNLLGSDSMGAKPNFKWTPNGTDSNGAPVFPATENAARIDYIADCYKSNTGSINDAANCGPAPSGGFTSGYKSGGVGNYPAQGTVAGANGSGSNWDKVDAQLTGSAASILQIATSLEYDLNKVDPSATVNSSTDAKWLKYVGYEIEFAAGTFSSTDWASPVLSIVKDQATGFDTIKVASASGAGLLTLGDPHVSPPKANLGSYNPPCLIGSSGGCGVPEPGTTWLMGLAALVMGWFVRKRSRSSFLSLPTPQ